MIEQLTLKQRLFVAFQYLLPHHFLSKIIQGITRIQWQPFKNRFINKFIQAYQVDMSIATREDPKSYDSFNDFFTRQLKPAARPISDVENAIVSPVDGMISEFGEIKNKQLIQAKGIEYSLQDLVHNNQDLIHRFENGFFLTIYLSPKDYHRIHMPITGTLEYLNFIKGRLFSVNTTTTRLVPRLFARNERLLNHFNTKAGGMSLIMVGAIFVSSIETVFNGIATKKSSQSYPAVTFQTGEEVGRFNMGSTVILLFEKDKIQWHKDLSVGKTVKMGEQIGIFN